MNNRDKSMFSVAKKISELSDYKTKRVHIGCVIVLGNRIISTGYNSNKTSPLQKKYNRLEYSEESPHKMHAEVKALTPLINHWSYNPIDFNKIKLYTYREKSNGELGSSRPCPRCMQLIKELGIKQLYYTTDDGFCEERIDLNENF